MASQRVAQAGRLKRQGLSPYARVGLGRCLRSSRFDAAQSSRLQHCPSRRETASRGSRTIGRSGDACRRPRQAACGPSAAIRSRDWSVIRTSAWHPTADLNCVHVSERTRREMGTGGNITVLPADGESSQDSSRLCSEEKGYLGNCILQPDPSGRVGFLIISLLIARTRRQHAEFFKRPVARRPRARTRMRPRNLSDRRCFSVLRFLI